MFDLASAADRDSIPNFPTAPDRSATSERVRDNNRPAPNAASAVAIHADWVRAFALRLVRDPDVAEDLTQDAMLAALDDQQRLVQSPRAWLASIVRNRLWAKLRGEDRRQRRERAVAREDLEPSTLDLVERNGTRRAIVEIVVGMPRKYREVLELRYFEERLPQEIAESQDVPIATVKTRLQRGLAMLAQRLERALEARHDPRSHARSSGEARGPRGADGTASLRALVWIAAAAIVLVALHALADPTSGANRVDLPAAPSALTAQMMQPVVTRDDAGEPEPT